MLGLPEGTEGMWLPTSYSILQSYQGPHMPRLRAMFLPEDEVKCLQRPHADSLSKMNMAVGTKGTKTERSG